MNKITRIILSFVLFIILSILVGRYFKSEKNATKKISPTYGQNSFASPEIKFPETETIKTTPNDSIFQIFFTGDSLFTQFLDKKTVFNSDSEFQKFMLDNRTQIQDRKVTFCTSGNAKYKRVVDIVNILNLPEIKIKDFKLLTK